MIPDFFFCSTPQSQERHERACAMLAMWRKYLPVTVLQAEPGDSFYFQSKRRQMAEERAITPIYVVADDDLEPSRTACPRTWVLSGVQCLVRYPEFGLLSPLLEKTNFTDWNPGSGYQPFVNHEVQEFHNTGGIRFTRKGILKDWPPQERRGYDQEQCDAMRALGYRSGYMKSLWAWHPGQKSETWKPISGFVSPPLDTVSF